MSLPARGRRRREPWGRFALRALLVLTLLLVTGGYLCDRFRIGIDDQQARCLGPTRWYLIDTHDQRPTRGRLVAFAATDAMAPYFRPGQTVIKRVVGVPGDRVSVDAERTTINGSHVRIAIRHWRARCNGLRPRFFVRVSWCQTDSSGSWATRATASMRAIGGCCRCSRCGGGRMRCSEPWRWPVDSCGADQSRGGSGQTQPQGIDTDQRAGPGGPRSGGEWRAGGGGHGSVPRTDPAQAHAIAAEIEGQPLPEWLRASGTGTSTSMGDVNDVHGLLQDARQRLSDGESQAAVCEALDADCGLPRSDGEVAATTDSAQPRTFLVFVSRSLGDAQLRELFALGSGRSDMRILFRGVDEGESLIDFVAALRPLLEGLDPPPTVLLDPTPFRTHGIMAVPTLVATGSGREEQARVSGLASSRWLRAALAEGDAVTSATAVPLPISSSPICWRNFTNAWPARPAGNEGRRVERAFERLRFEPLPAAGEDRERLIDPTIIAAADIQLPDGTLLVRAGDTVNPLERLPFTQRLVVFDAADSDSSPSRGNAPPSLQSGRRPSC